MTLVLIHKKLVIFTQVKSKMKSVQNKRYNSHCSLHVSVGELYKLDMEYKYLFFSFCSNSFSIVHWLTKNVSNDFSLCIKNIIFRCINM